MPLSLLGALAPKAFLVLAVVLMLARAWLPVGRHAARALHARLTRRTAVRIQIHNGKAAADATRHGGN
jgi:hypothetical protein